MIHVNNNNQSPLFLSINNDNYIIVIEFLIIVHKIWIYTIEEYFDFLDIVIKKGNCLDKDCIELINVILSNIEENNII